MIIDFLLLQTPSATESFTRLQQTIGLIAVNIGTVIATSVIVLKFVNDLRASLKQAKETARQLIDSKDEIVTASDRNYEAIKMNTAVTEKQAVEMQRHLIDRIRRELIPLSQRLGKLEAHLFTAEESGSAPTQAWKNDDSNQSS